jgi:hypothetical protein
MMAIEKIKLPAIKKHNSLTDGYIPKSSKQVLPDKLLNALYYKYEREGNKFVMSLSELKQLLGLRSDGNVERIYEAIGILRHPVAVKDFTYKGKKAKWASVSFLKEAVRWVEKENFIEFEISDMMIEVLKQKVGYTELDLDICSRFKTKYGLKIYEMYKRYYRVKNDDKNLAIIKKDLDELNKKFGSEYKTPSGLLRGIQRGLKEIKKITGEDISCFYDKKKKFFVFFWKNPVKYPKLRIPYKRVDELVEWYLEHQKDGIDIKDMQKYRKSLKKSILEDEFEGLDALYRGMMTYKYNILDIEKYYDESTGKYKDFHVKNVKTLFDV